MRKKSEFKTIDSKLIYRGRVFDLKKIRKRAPDGKILEHDIIFHLGAAVIIPVLDDGRLVLVRQFRTAADARIWEFPAGTLEKGELPLACAKREIVEETGFQAKKWTKLAEFYPAPGFSKEFMYLYLAEELSEKTADKDSDEYLEHHIISFKDVEKMVQRGEIIDAKTLIGFYFYSLKRGRKK